MFDQYLIACLYDENQYVLATRTVFNTKECAEEYMRTVAPERKPILIGCMFPIKDDIRKG